MGRTRPAHQPSVHLGPKRTGRERRRQARRRRYRDPRPDLDGTGVLARAVATESLDQVAVVAYLAARHEQYETPPAGLEPRRPRPPSCRPRPGSARHVPRRPWRGRQRASRPMPRPWTPRPPGSAADATGRPWHGLQSTSRPRLRSCRPRPRPGSTAESPWRGRQRRSSPRPSPVRPGRPDNAADARESPWHAPPTRAGASKPRGPSSGWRSSRPSSPTARARAGAPPWPTSRSWPTTWRNPCRHQDQDPPTCRRTPTGTAAPSRRRSSPPKRPPRNESAKKSRPTVTGSGSRSKSAGQPSPRR